MEMVWNDVVVVALSSAWKATWRELLDMGMEYAHWEDECMMQGRHGLLSNVSLHVR